MTFGKQKNKVMMEGEWMSRDTFLDYSKQSSIPPLLRLLLLFDGTVTHFLEAFFLETIGFELKAQSDIVISDEDAIRLSLPKGEKGIKRQGWLTLKGGPKVLHVDSILPTSRLTPPFHQEVLLGQKALGQIMHDQGLLFRRDHIAIGRFSLPRMMCGFGSPSDQPIWARRYRLTLSGEGSMLIFEAISAEMIDFMINNNKNV
jgi:chorismate-pyruvate lyase